MILTVILACSIGLQLVATCMAFRLIRLTGRYIAWSLVAIALLLMIIRRALPFYHLLAGDMFIQLDALNETIGLALSLFLVIGIGKIGPLFSSIRLSEESARNAEEKYRSLFDHANDAIYLVEYQTLKILDYNKKASEMLGYSREELQAMTFPDLHPRIEKSVLQEKLKEMDEKGTVPETLILHHKKKDGTMVIIEMNVSMIEVKGEKLIFSIVRNVTERKLNEDKIRLFFQATDNSVEAICLSDLDKRIIYVNNAFEKLFGYARKEIIGTKVSVIYPDDTWERIQKAIQYTHDGSLEGEFTGRKNDGTQFPLLLSSSRILNDSGNIIARMATHRDITELKQAEEKLITYTEQLRSLSDHLTTVREEERLFLAREIHDGFGSSLSGLKMDLMMLKRNLMKKCNDDINAEVADNIQSMSDLIDNTIVLMRRLVRELRPEILDELGLVEAVKWYIKEFEKRTFIKFHLTIFPRNIKTDIKQAITIFRIFQEILINIARHSKATEVTVFLRKQKQTIHLLIHDNGIGIKPEQINNKKSLGILGMKERALIFGGKLQIEGIEGQGTTVKVEIPVP
jgi:two-component system sensor histidine kinase UhpB